MKIQAHMEIETVKGRILTHNFTYDDQEGLVEHAEETLDQDSVQSVRVTSLKTGNVLYHEWWEDDYKIPLGVHYLVMTIDDEIYTKIAARERFYKKYGYNPRQVLLQKGQFWVGPRSP